MPAISHEEIRNELFGGPSENGRRQYEAFRVEDEARQVDTHPAGLREAAGLPLVVGVDENQPGRAYYRGLVRRSPPPGTCAPAPG